MGNKNKEFINNKPLTQSYVREGTTIEVYGELNIKQFAKFIHNYLINKKNNK